MWNYVYNESIIIVATIKLSFPLLFSICYSLLIVLLLLFLLLLSLSLLQSIITIIIVYGGFISRGKKVIWNPNGAQTHRERHRDLLKPLYSMKFLETSGPNLGFPMVFQCTEGHTLGGPWP